MGPPGARPLDFDSRCQTYIFESRVSGAQATQTRAPCEPCALPPSSSADSCRGQGRAGPARAQRASLSAQRSTCAQAGRSLDGVCGHSSVPAHGGSHGRRGAGCCAKRKARVQACRAQRDAACARRPAGGWAVWAHLLGSHRSSRRPSPPGLMPSQNPMGAQAQVRWARRASLQRRAPRTRFHEVSGTGVLARSCKLGGPPRCEPLSQQHRHPFGSSAGAALAAEHAGPRQGAAARPAAHLGRGSHRAASEHGSPAAAPEGQQLR